jgi:hypothetical protein
MSLSRQNGTQLISYRQDGTDRRPFGALGHVSGLKYGYATPGGCDTLSFNLMIEPNVRTQIMDPGRIVEAYRGGGKIWEGILTEAVPTPQGWQVSATGAGQYGAKYVASYTEMWPTSQPDNSINNAISRGLRWKNPGVGTPGMWLGASGSFADPNGGVTLCSATIPAGTWEVSWIVGFTAGTAPTSADNNNFGLYQGGTLLATATVDAVNNGVELYVQTPVSVSGGSPSTISVKTIGVDGTDATIVYYACLPPAGAWLGQQVDPAAQTITSLMNLCCTYGGLTWWVNTTQYGNTLELFPLPTIPDRLLIATSPVPRTVAQQPTTIFERFEFAADTVTHAGTANVAQYRTATTIDTPSAARYGATEEYIDVSQAGVMSAASAQLIGANVLNRYLRASFGGTFDVMPGQLLTYGGQPVDLGSETSLHVYQLILTDYGYGGEVTLLPPITFLGGKYEYDDDKQVGSVTPFQYAASSISDLLSAASTMLPTPFQSTINTTAKTWSNERRVNQLVSGRG